MEDLSGESTDANEWLMGYCLLSAQAKRPTIWIELHVHVDGQSIYLCHPWSLSQGARGMRIKGGDPAAFLRHEPHRVINGALAQLIYLYWVSYNAGTPKIAKIDSFTMEIPENR